MKRSSIMAAAMALILSSSAQAQWYRYPLDIYTEADESLSTSPYSLPMIATGELTEYAAESIRDSEAVLVRVQSSGLDYQAYRSLAAHIDGYVLSGGEDLLFLKALVDYNVPVLGNSEELDELRQGVMHQSNDWSCNEFVRYASAFQHARVLMSHLLTVDTHGDLACEYKRGASISRRGVNQISIQKMLEGGLRCHFLDAYMGQGPLDDESSQEAVRYINSMLDAIEADIEQAGDAVRIVYSVDEALRTHAGGVMPFFLAIENGYGIGNDISNIERYARRGVKYITLSHTRDNAICHTSSQNSADTTKGLTPFGIEAIREMNRCGIMVDVSHTSEGTFWDVFKYSSAPFICSHSGAKAVYDHNRSLTDRQIRALAEKGGVIQVYIVPDFMDDKPRWNDVSINHFMDHLNHCVAVAGIDHVGIGADFDGGGGGWGLNGDNDMINITVRLILEGYSDRDIAKLWGGNILRVLRACEQTSQLLSL